MNMLKISGFITKSTENWWHFAERNGFFETSSPFSFCSPAFFCMLTLTPILFWANSMISFFLSRPQNFRDFRRSSGSIVSLWMRKLEKLTFFGAKKTQGNSTKNNWLKNGPWMKMSRIENGHFPAFSMLVLPKESTPMISEIPKDLESDVTEVHDFFLEGWIQRWPHVFGKMQNITLPEGKGYYRRKFRSLTFRQYAELKKQSRDVKSAERRSTRV